MSRTLTFSLTLLAMVAFAGNSILCRLALKGGRIDAASFTAVRIVSGALALWLIVRLREGRCRLEGSWPSALALFAYAAGFSYAYVSLPAATGALLLFGAVQATMIGYGLRAGERLGMRQWAGLVCAVGGLAGLLLPGLQAPPLAGSAAMLGAGVAWGAYSVRGKGAGSPLRVTTGNFLRAVPLAAVLGVATLSRSSPDVSGLWYAACSGALASGVGYALWYAALRSLKATTAATVQLCVPVIAAAGGVLFLGEAISVRLVVASGTILGGIALVILPRRAARR